MSDGKNKDPLSYFKTVSNITSGETDNAYDGATRLSESSDGHANQPEPDDIEEPPSPPMDIEGPTDDGQTNQPEPDNY